MKRGIGMRKGALLFAVVFSLGLAACNNSNAQGNDTPSHEHTFNTDVWEFDTQYHWHPSTCGHDVTTQKIAHIFNDVITPATYENGGYTTHTCTVCGYSFTDSQTTPLVHNYSNTWSYNSSAHWHACTDSGYTELKKDEGPHSFIETVVAPTYESEGYTAHNCNTCDYYYIDNQTSKLVHNFESGWSHNSSTHWHACTDIGYENLKKDETSHTFNDVVTPATYEHGGYTTRTCTICGYSYVTNETSTLKFTVTFLNYDNSLLHEVEVEKGSTAIYSWADPTRPSTDTYTYSFAGWDKTLENVQESFSTKAIYNEIEKYTEGLQFEANQNDGYSIVGYTGISKNVIIPSKDSGKSVNKVNDLAFANKSIYTLVIPNSVTSIGTNILLNVNLQQLSVPFIGNGSGNYGYLSYFFGGNSYNDNETYVPSSLSSVTILGDKEISQYAFYGCYLITSIRILGEVKTLSNYSFSNTSALNSIVFPQTLETIGDYCFNNSGLKSISLPNTLKEIGSCAFSKCNVLQLVQFGHSIELCIKDNCFYNCTKLKSVYFSGTATEWASIKINDYFANPCSYGGNLYVLNESNNFVEGERNLKKHLVISSDILALSETIMNTYLSDADPSYFESIFVPNSVSNIEPGTFANFVNLKSIELPFIGTSNNATFEEATFGIIFGIKETSNASFSYQRNYSGNGGSDGTKRSLYNYTGGGTVSQMQSTRSTALSKVENFHYAYVSSSYSSQIGTNSSPCLNTTVYVKRLMFNIPENLQEIIIGDNTNAISEGAFSNMNLNSIIFKGNIDSVHNYAFYKSSISSIYVNSEESQSAFSNVVGSFNVLIES